LRHVCRNDPGATNVQRDYREHNPDGERIVRRQTQDSGHSPAGSGRVERLDPFSLPLRFTVSDNAADARTRIVELSRERVVHHRAVRGIPMAVKVPLATYLGVVLRMEPPDAEQSGAVTLVLTHDDPSLSLPLYRAEDGSEVVAEWQSWARALSLPLLVAEADGALRAPFDHLGALRISRAQPRRRRHSPLRRRRASIPLRRKPGRAPAVPTVHCGEREIIARN
jgi:hypothetical protein